MEMLGALARRRLLKLLVVRERRLEPLRDISLDFKILCPSFEIVDEIEQIARITEYFLIIELENVRV